MVHAALISLSSPHQSYLTQREPSANSPWRETETSHLPCIDRAPLAPARQSPGFCYLIAGVTITGSTPSPDRDTPSQPRLLCQSRCSYSPAPSLDFLAS